MRKNICKYWIENSFLSREYQQEIKEKNTMGLMCWPWVSNHATFEKQLNTDLEPIHNKGGCYGTRNQSTISKDWL